MKRFHAIMLFGILATQAGAAMAVSGSLNEFKPRVMPVLVHVNSKGKITDVSPSTQLSPVFNRLLLQNLDELITKPATTRKGRPIDSQFIINLALQVTPRKEGDYDAHFAYVSSLPVPSGSWYWVHINGHQLALANQADRWQNSNFRHYRETNRTPDNRFYQHQSNPAVQNAVRSTSQSVRAPASAPAHAR
jgi:hypothetical protein